MASSYRYSYIGFTTSSEASGCLVGGPPPPGESSDRGVTSSSSFECPDAVRGFTITTTTTTTSTSNAIFITQLTRTSLLQLTGVSSEPFCPHQLRPLVVLFGMQIAGRRASVTHSPISSSSLQLQMQDFDSDEALKVYPFATENVDA